MPTKVYTTSESAYTALDPGPCLVEVNSRGRVRVHVGTTLPAAGELAHHVLQYPAETFTYNGTETVYVRADDSDEPGVVATHVV